MTFHELIRRQHWLSVETELNRLYPDQEEQIDAYREVFNQLMEMKPDPSSDIVIRLIEIREEDENYVDVDGYHADGSVDPLSGNDGLALEFTPWDSWLGMKVDERAFKEFTELEIIVHCLYEMTFFSFDQEEIAAQLEELNKNMAEFKNMTPGEKRRNNKSIDDFLSGLGEGEDE
ncbi:DUF6557 family protein [Cyclobacterium jeungdonense]|uniref:Uncharacterized protein n=1 Tax=Cyclobacterium jeungdonense TaxID=708087 RepID=A0ABT8CF17_9BACT|nr:DUF6557 family protein [Cyclobacterium jeungdonense]MDN3690178.1 hypothetical protein [Cyclobacterium jeungdonense]